MVCITITLLCHYHNVKISKILISITYMVCITITLLCHYHNVKISKD